MPFWWCKAITKITFLIFVSPFSAVYRLLANKQGDKWFILDRAVRTKEQFYMSSFTCWDSTMSTIEQIEIPIYEFTSKTLPMVCLLAWENSWHLATPALVFPRNDVWETSAEIPYWWRVTTQIWVVLLIGRAREICFNQSEARPRSG